VTYRDTRCPGPPGAATSCCSSGSVASPEPSTAPAPSARSAARPTQTHPHTSYMPNHQRSGAGGHCRPGPLQDRRVDEVLPTIGPKGWTISAGRGARGIPPLEVWGWRPGDPVPSGGRGRAGGTIGVADLHQERVSERRGPTGSPGHHARDAEPRVRLHGRNLPGSTCSGASLRFNSPRSAESPVRPWRHHRHIDAIAISARGVPAGQRRAWLAEPTANC
jgi:hypothetical protein